MAWGAQQRHAAGGHDGNCHWRGRRRKRSELGRGLLVQGQGALGLRAGLQVMLLCKSVVHRSTVRTSVELDVEP